MLGMVVSYLDPDIGLRDPGTKVILSLDLTSQASDWTLETGVITVAGLDEMLPQTMEWKATGPNGETLGCPPSYCQMPAPLGGIGNRPSNCGFAPVRDNVTQPAP